jgi:hypothetical protein
MPVPWELVSSEVVQAPGPGPGGLRLTLRLPEGSPDVRADRLDVGLLDHRDGHRVVVSVMRDGDGEEGDTDGGGGGDGSEGAGELVFECACGFLADVEATRVKLKRNKGKVSQRPVLPIGRHLFFYYQRHPTFNAGW